MKASPPGEMVGVVVRPWFVVSLTLLILNDWVLKPFYGNAFTGKVSDFAGLALVAFVLSRLGAVTNRRWPAAVLSAGVALFVAAKCFPVVASWVAGGLDSVLPWSSLIVPDATDVVALAVVPFAWWRGQQTPHRRVSLPSSIEPVLRWGLGCLGVLACAASSSTDVEHWLYVNDDGVVVVYETLDAAAVDAPVYGPELFSVDQVDRDGSWNGEPVRRAEVELDDLLFEGESCNRVEPAHCVASPDSLSIVESFDGGDTWETIWVIDPDSKYASQDWVNDQLVYVEREAGIRQLVLADDGTVVGIVAPDVFVARSPDGTWVGGESWFRPLPRGSLVQLVGGFALLTLVAAASLRTLPTRRWSLSQTVAALGLLVIVGQVGFISPFVIGALGVGGIVLVVQSLFGHQGRSGRDAVLRCLVWPGLVSVGGVLLMLEWQENGGSLEVRRLIHLAAVLTLWALSAIGDSVNRSRSSSLGVESSTGAAESHG